MAHSVYRPCTLCEAHCGLRFDVENNRIVSVRADEDDVLSAGFICPKGTAFGDIHHDPDRLRTPMVRTASGGFEPSSWDDALDRAAAGLRRVRDRHGRDGVGCYIGNPVIHNHGALIARSGLLRALGTRNSFSASSQDTAPRFATSYHLYGSSLVLPIPDVDRTDYFLCLGANPLVSNGSVLTAPNLRARLRAIQQRGGKVVVVDPRRTETAKLADEFVPVRPGTDAALLLAMAAVIVERGKASREAIERIASGWAEVEQHLRELGRTGLEAVAAETGIAAATIERLALEFADAPTSTAYSRVGVCNSRHGTLATYATDLLNLVAGRLGAVGGAMFTTPAIDSTRLTRLPGMDGHGRWKSRVRGLPETLGDLPSAALAEEIETPGPGQIRGMLTFAGNPVLSTPNGRRLDAAFADLEFMVSIDIYVNETTRHADVILPPAWTLADEHVDVFFPQMTIRNVVGWAPPVVEAGENDRADWEIMVGLAERLGGGPTGMKPLDALFGVARRFGYRWSPMQTIDLLLRTGTYGDRFLPWRKGLSIEKLKRHPHGIDLGPLEPGVTRRVLHRDRRVHIAPRIFLDALGQLKERLAATAAAPAPSTELLLIGRRDLRSNNSWMHNVASLVSGRPRCVLLVHPEDAARAGLEDGKNAVLESRVHSAEVPIRVTDEMVPGVVSLPHGWGHAPSAPWQRVAGDHAGVSINDWSDDTEVESLVGQSILNGVRVRVRAVEGAGAGDRTSTAA